MALHDLEKKQDWHMDSPNDNAITRKMVQNYSSDFIQKRRK